MEELTSKKSCHLIIDIDCEDLWNYSYRQGDYGQDASNRLCLDKKNILVFIGFGRRLLQECFSHFRLAE